ncbi:spastin-like [Frankliniella occidentalis]|uniref:Spastin-like n=1 Tax=Frankliniella occidentalis TaxID=133901 RepID=A0A9C6X6B4_FRAOC|nr:spastin-like [Frankliniella occidentalis]
MVVYPMLNPALFQGLRRPGRGLLLFGPPGTGKTLIGKCLATEARATFFSITSSSFGSKWYGESETLAKTLFECARALQPSIIFIDEVDSILKSARDTDGGCSTRLRTELLACMDGCTSTGKEEVLVVGATNWPGKIDEAARRRFTRRLYVPLPDEETRLEQFKHELSQEKHSISEDEFGLIAEKTKGYSGADITQVCRNAAMKPIRSLDPNGPSIEFITMDEVRPMNLSDFLESVNETTKSVSQEMIDQLEDFNNKFGSL